MAEAALMQQFWVHARNAMSIVTRETFNELSASQAICERAHAGLLKTKADVYFVGDEKREDVLVPPEFWWAEGHEALEQDWSRGDFETWIDQKARLRAFGVRFDFEGLRKLLPAEKAAAALRELSVAAHPNWLSAKAARRFMYERLGSNINRADVALIQECKLGFVPARAQLMQRSDRGHFDNWNVEEREWEVPIWFWQHFTAGESSSQNWEQGVFRGRGRGPSDSCIMQLTGVHFSKPALEALASEPTATMSEPVPNKGGRPPKDWWDDLWCAVWGKVVHGELTPKTQADVERAMLDWVSERGEAVAESTIRLKARKLFVEWDREAEN